MNIFKTTHSDRMSKTIWKVTKTFGPSLEKRVIVSFPWQVTKNFIFKGTNIDIWSMEMMEG